MSLAQLRELSEARDSVFASPALRAFVARATRANAELPGLLESYQVGVESEVSILQAEPDGRELVLQLEQVASDVLWRRDHPPVQQVVGYRARTVGLIPSALTMFEVPWVVPTLYGDRIDLVRWGEPEYSDEGRLLRRRAIHPLSPEGPSVYQYEGGDTVLVLNLPDRRLSLVRVEVEPVRWPDRPTLLFEGYMDIDATRHQIVRMRGRMISADPDPSAEARLLGAAFSGATFVEFENAEYDGRFWLPRYQRIEVQARSKLTEGRTALRVVSRFGFPELNERGVLAARFPDPPPGGVLRVGAAVREADFAGWDTGLGELTAEANALDFVDLEPGRARSAAGPWVDWGVRYPSHLVRFNDPEGIFTGFGLTLHPGTWWQPGRVRLHGGWAWAEGTPRGGVEISHLPAESDWEWLARAERQVRSTGDFALSYGREVGIPPLVAGDGELLYDHRVLGLVVRQPRGGGWSWRLEAGRGEDRAIPYDLDEPDEGEAVILPVRDGDYWLGRATLERNAGGTAFNVVPGTSLRLDVEGATGELEWVRVEAGLSARRVLGRVSLDGRLDAGAVLSDDPPPQRIFELGRYSGLPGYPARAFAGERAVLVQTGLGYTLPVLGRPLHLGGFILPALAPTPAVLVRAGWTGFADGEDGAADPGDALGPFFAPTTDGVRTTVDLRLRLFGGGVSLGAARPLDEGGEWRFVWSLAGEF